MIVGQLRGRRRGAAESWKTGLRDSEEVEDMIEAQLRGEKIELRDS